MKAVIGSCWMVVVVVKGGGGDGDWSWVLCGERCPANNQRYFIFSAQNINYAVHIHKSFP